MSTITSIKGLQNLQELQNFRADWNSLQSVNLSNLPNLLDVDISDNNFPGSDTNSLKSVNLSGSTAIEELRLDDSDFSRGIPDISALTSLTYLDLDQCRITGSVDLSSLTSLKGFDFSSNTGLTQVIISDSQPLGDGESINLRNCSLTQSAIDNILVALSTNGVSNGFINISEGTNAAPGVTGLAAIALLEDDGWTVTKNASPIFDITANWSLTTPAVVDEASFRTFLEEGQDGDGNSNSFTDVVITDFSLVGDRLTCNLSANGDTFYLTYTEVTDVSGIGNIVGLLDLYLYNNQITTFDIELPSGFENLELGGNQIVTFDPSLPLPSSLQTLGLGNNQMTTAGYTASEPWANAMSVIPGRNVVNFNANINSVSGTDLETILISKGWSVIV